MGNTIKNIAVSGATGFIGSHLSAYLSGAGYHVVPLGRNLFTDSAADRLCELVAECDAVINLAGAPINHRWSETYKQTLYESRIDVTRRLVGAIARSPRTELFISASAVGYYSTEGCNDEWTGRPGTGFLTELCSSWEAEARKVPPHVRLAITRFGLVLAPHGGVFGKMGFPASKGVATVLGDGSQFFPWIDIADLVRAMGHVIRNPVLEGVFNFVSTQLLTQSEFMVYVARHYRAPIRVRVPVFVLRMVYGEAAEFLTQGQCVIAARLAESGFNFVSPEIDQFLERLK